MTHRTSLVTDSIVQAAHWLKAGQLLAYPTESVWGIGCDAYDEAAVRCILDIKQRPQSKGMIVVTDSVARLAPLLEALAPHQRQQVINSWQMDDGAHTADAGQPKHAHTWLLPIPKRLATSIPPWITGRHQTLAVRVIAHPLIRQLCQQLIHTDNPFGLLVSTSCNPSGQPPALTLEEAQEYFGERMCYLQAETLGYGLPSQIREATTGSVIR